MPPERPASLSQVLTGITLVSIVFSAGAAWTVTNLSLADKVGRHEFAASRDTTRREVERLRLADSLVQARLDSLLSMSNDIRCEVLKSRSRLAGCR